jgi:hypothetical protein
MTNDLYALDVPSLVWTRLETPQGPSERPTPRYFAGLEAWKDYLVLFGKRLSLASLPP